MIFSNSSTLYICRDDLKQISRDIQKRLAAEARSRHRRPEPMVCIPFAVYVKPQYDGDYG